MFNPLCSLGATCGLDMKSCPKRAFLNAGSEDIELTGGIWKPVCPGIAGSQQHPLMGNHQLDASVRGQ